MNAKQVYQIAYREELERIAKQDARKDAQLIRIGIKPAMKENDI